MAKKDSDSFCETFTLVRISESQISEETANALEDIDICSGKNGSLYSVERILMNFEERETENKRFKKPKAAPKSYARCDNCSFSHRTADPDSFFTHIKDLYQRIEPGRIVPSSECPKCQSLAYPSPFVDSKQSPGQFLAAIEGYDYVLIS